MHLQLYDAQHIGFEGRQMTRAELHKTLTPLLTENPDRTITIEIDGWRRRARCDCYYG